MQRWPPTPETPWRQQSTAQQGFVTPEPRMVTNSGDFYAQEPLNHEEEVNEDDDADMRAKDAPFDSSSPSEFAQTHFQRRNRLENRLQELQKDVASLTLKLRSGSNRSSSTAGGQASLDMITPPLAPAPTAVTDNKSLSIENDAPFLRRKSSKKALRTQKQPATRTRLGISENTTPTTRIPGGSSRAMMRELHTVTIERDQLRLELDKTKRMLLTTEKKYEETLKSKASYEKLKAHCDSLQESLDLSEKIRLRQKKLLQQFQQQQPAKFDPYIAKKASVPSATLASRLTTRNFRTRANSKQDQDYDVLDSLVQSSPMENGLREIDAATSRLRSRSDQNSQKARTTSQSRSNFDGLLHTVHAPRSAARQQNGGMLTSKSTRESSRTRRPNEEEAPNAYKRVRSKSHGVTLSTNAASSGPVTPTKRPSRPHFLASTQASRSRREAISKDPVNLRRRPFVV